MSACTPLLDLSEQLCYVHCGFCTTILLVSVPRSSLSKVVTVRCGHCQGLLAVDMRSVPLVPLQLLSSIGVEEQKREHTSDDPIRATDGLNAPLPTAGYGENKEAAGEEEEEEEEDEEEDITDAAPMNTTTVNKPPEKRQRAPSAYNRFIKDEIKRIKGRVPGVTHKEAFSTAAKSWAHFPRIQKNGGDGECCSMVGDGASAEKVEGDQSQDIHKKKIQRRSVRTTASFQ